MLTAHICASGTRRAAPVGVTDASGQLIKGVRVRVTARHNMEPNFVPPPLKQATDVVGTATTDPFYRASQIPSGFCFKWHHRISMFPQQDLCGHHIRMVTKFNTSNIYSHLSCSQGVKNEYIGAYNQRAHVLANTYLMLMDVNVLHV